MQMFSKFKVDYNPLHWKKLFLSVYVIDQPLAADQPFEKWKYKIMPGIYLGMSTIHARKVDLVLRPANGRVSPYSHR